MGGKYSSSPPPAYGNVASADANIANKQFKLGEQQLQFGRNNFNTVWPFARQYLTQQLKTSQQQEKFANQQRAIYEGTYLPIEKSFARTAMTYNTPARANQNAAAAMSDVAHTFDAARTSALQNLESFGVDPSQTRFGALDMASRVQKAAAMAAAGTQSRLNTQNTALALQGEAINTGRGYPSSVAQSVGSGTGAGSAGLSGITGASTIGNLGTPASYMGIGANLLGEEGSMINAGMNYQYQVGANQSAGLGGLFGTAIGGGLDAAALGLI